MSIARVLVSLRNVLPREGVVVSSAGQPQETTNPQFPVYEPRTNVSCGGFSTMGFGVSAAIGAKLASPDRPVVDIEGEDDGLAAAKRLLRDGNVALAPGTAFTDDPHGRVRLSFANSMDRLEEGLDRIEATV